MWGVVLSDFGRICARAVPEWCAYGTIVDVSAGACGAARVSLSGITWIGSGGVVRLVVGPWLVAASGSGWGVVSDGSG